LNNRGGLCNNAVGSTKAALLQKAEADGITVLEAKKTPNPIQQMQNLMGEIGENLPKLTNEQQDKLMKGAVVGAAAAGAIGLGILGIRSLMTNSSNPSVPTQTTPPQDFNITDQGLLPYPSNKTPFGSSTTPPADKQVPSQLPSQLPPELEGIQRTLTPPKLTPEEVNDGLGGVYKALITPKGDPGSWNMKIDYVPGHADISEDMRKLALNMAAGGMAQKLQDTEQHKNAAGDTITALKMIAAKTGVEEKKVLEAYATAASNAAKDITGTPTPTDHQKTMQAALEGVQECIKENTKLASTLRSEDTENISFNFPPNSSNQTGSSRGLNLGNNSKPDGVLNSSNQNIEYTNNSINNPRNPLDKIVTPDANAGTPPPGAKMLTPAQMQADAAAHQGFGLGEVAGGTLKALGVVGLVMSVAQLRENLTTLKDDEKNVSLKTIGRRFAEDGLYNVAMAGRIMGMTVSTFGHSFHPAFGIAAYAAMQSTEKGLEKATAAYGKASQSLAITKLRLADGTSQNAVQDRTVAAVQQGLVYATSANKQTSQFLNTARAAAIAVIKNPQQAMQDMGTRFNTLKTQIKIPTMPWKRDNKMQQFSETAREVQETENRVHGNKLMAFLHFRWGKQAST
jgi:hypothetical protein